MASPVPPLSEQPPGNPASDEFTVVYDGECPVCTAYTCNVDLDAARKLHNARVGGAVVEKLAGMGLDLDEGMVVIRQGEIYHGADALHIMALHSARKGLLNRLNYLIFRSRSRARLLYPALRLGRNTLLRLLGRKKLNLQPGSPGQSKLDGRVS